MVETVLVLRKNKSLNFHLIHSFIVVAAAVQIHLHSIGYTCVRALAGTLVFPPGVDEQRFRIEVIDDDVFEQDEHFYVKLTNPSTDVSLATPQVATVMILDDDHGGIFALSSKDHEICESVGVYELKVQRYSGARGKVRVPFCTEDGTAKAGKDYEMFQGELEFDNNESE